MLKILHNLYKDYFEIFTEDDSNLSTQDNPEFTIKWYKGRVRRKLIDTQYTS